MTTTAKELNHVYSGCAQTRMSRCPCLVLWALLALCLVSCTAWMPTVEEVNGVVLDLRQYSMRAWALGIAALWADLALPVPQTAVIAALGIIYGVIGGGLISSFGLVTGGLLGYAVACRYGRRLVARLVGDRSLKKVESLFEHGGMWAIVLTRSLRIVFRKPSFSCRAWEECASAKSSSL